MSKQKAVLLISEDNLALENLAQLICDKQHISLYILKNLSEASMVVKQVPCNLYILNLQYNFKEQDYLEFIKDNPNTIIICNKKLVIYSYKTCIVKSNDLEKLESLIPQKVKAEECKFFNEKNPFLKQTVERALTFFGFSHRYKGYDYLVSTVMLVMKHNKPNISLRKYVYPTISKEMNISELSIERDIRTLINRTPQQAIEELGQKPKDLILSVVSHVQNYLARLTDVKLSY